MLAIGILLFLQDIGLSMIDNRVTVSHLLLRSLNLLEFPLAGHVTIEDNRTSCDDRPGPCQAIVYFVLELVQYEIPCPDNILRFSSSKNAAVEWIAPVVRKLSGLSTTLSGTYKPGDSMALGKTIVKYDFPLHVSQAPTTYITCNFTVRD